MSILFSYDTLEDFMTSIGKLPENPVDVYRDIFQVGCGYIQKNKEKNNLKGNPLGYFRNWNEENGYYRVFTDDNFEEVLPEMQAADFAIMNGITYFGRRNTQERASKCFALILDIDGVTPKKLRFFLERAEKHKQFYAYPLPNYVALSGHNVHLYYLFEEPVSLFPSEKLKLKELKYCLIEKIWNEDISTDKKRQFQGINQGFRVIGGKTKPNATLKKVMAYKFRSEKYTVDELIQYIPESLRPDSLKGYKKSTVTLEEAKKRWPDWYEKVIVNKDTSRTYWDIAGKVHGDDPYALYHWWLKQLPGRITYGHRYFCVMATAIYAAKCGIPFEKFKKDAYELFELIQGVEADEPFTVTDLESAFDCYDGRYRTFPIEDISRLTTIPIKKNRRNGRTMQQHLRLARLARDIKYEEIGRKWYEGNGRPKDSSKFKSIIAEWRKKYPEGTVKECMADTGIAQRTIYNWWKRVENIPEE